MKEQLDKHEEVVVYRESLTTNDLVQRAVDGVDISAAECKIIAKAKAGEVEVFTTSCQETNKKNLKAKHGMRILPMSMAYIVDSEGRTVDLVSGAEYTPPKKHKIKKDHDDGEQYIDLVPGAPVTRTAAPAFTLINTHLTNQHDLDKQRIAAEVEKCKAEKAAEAERYKADAERSKAEAERSKADAERSKADILRLQIQMQAGIAPQASNADAHM